MNIKIGDEVGYAIGSYRPIVGTAKIVSMELTEPHKAEGVPISIVGLESVKAGRVVFDLDNNKWAYSDQIHSVNGIKI